MKFIVCSLFLAALVAPTLAGTYGYDFNVAVSEANFRCLKSKGVELAIPRVWHSTGTYDTVGIANVKRAHAAGMKFVDAYLFPCLASHCASGANQVRATINKLRADGAKIGVLWLDIERFAWPANHASNRRFIEAMVAEAKAMNQQVGIYTNYYNWEEIVGLDYHGQANLPLWWAHYDGVIGYKYFKSFGGWSYPHLHQYKGDVVGYCGISTDINWGNFD